MDAFIEKIVKKKRGIADVAMTIGIYLAAIILMLVAMMFLDPSFGLLIGFGLFYGAYWLTGLRKLEFEYAFTSGELDIDKIVAQRKRKRIFSQHCKEFDLVARVDSSQYTPQIRSMKDIIDASSSREAPDLWFIVTRYNGKGTVVYLELSAGMVEAMSVIIPRKVFKK